MALNDQEEAAIRAQLATAEAKRQAAEAAAEERRKALETERTAHKTALDSAAAEHAKALGALGAVEAERKGWTTERALLERGLTDPTDRKVALLLHGDLPEAGRPDLGAWLDGFRSDPTKAPRQLSHVWTPPAGVQQAGPKTGAETGGSGAGAGGAGAGAGDRKVPPLVKSGETGGSAGGQVTREQIRAAGQRARHPQATQADKDAYRALVRDVQ